MKQLPTRKSSYLIGIAIFLLLLAVVLLAWFGLIKVFDGHLAPSAVTASNRLSVDSSKDQAGESPRLENSEEPLDELPQAKNLSDSIGPISGRLVSEPSGIGIVGGHLTFESDGAVASVASGARGEFTFRPSSIGELVLLTAVAEGHLPFAPQWGSSQVKFITKPGEQIADVVIRLQSTKNLIGLVIDSGGKPVEGASARVAHATEWSGDLVLVPGAYKTDSRGEFEFEALEGSQVEVRHAQHAVGWARIGWLEASNGRVTIRLGSIVGSKQGLIAGRVLDPGGRPIPGAKVYAAPKSTVSGVPFRVASTDIGGEFELTGVTDKAKWDLRAEMSPFGPAFADDVAAGARVELVLSDAASIRGIVVDDDRGEPISAFEVSYALPSSGGYKAVGRRTIYDASGEFEIVGLAPGLYTLFVSVAGYVSQTRDNIMASTDKAGMREVFRVERGASIAGRVIDSRANTPIAGALLVLGGRQSFSRLERVVTTDKGQFRIDGIEGGMHILMASANGYGRKAEEFDIEPGTNIEMSIELNPVDDSGTSDVQMVGIGVMLHVDTDRVVVVGVVPGSGAFEAGLTVSDLILAIDGQETAGGTAESMGASIRGPENTFVSLRIRKAGGSEENLQVERRRIQYGTIE